METFANSVETVKKTLAAIPAIRSTLTDLADENTAEDSIRHICENGLVKIVSSFQRYAEACFHKLAKLCHSNFPLYDLTFFGFRLKRCRTFT